MAAAKTSGNTTANPIEDATKKVAELNEEATQKVTALAEENTKKLAALNEDATQKLAAFAEQTTKQLTELAEQAKAAQKQQSLAAIDAYEQAVLALADSFEQAASRAAQGRDPQPRRRHARDHHRLHRRGAPARQLTRSSEVLAAVAPFGAAAAFVSWRRETFEVVNLADFNSFCHTGLEAATRP